MLRILRDARLSLAAYECMIIGEWYPPDEKLREQIREIDAVLRAENYPSACDACNQGWPFVADDRKYHVDPDNVGTTHCALVLD